VIIWSFQLRTLFATVWFKLTVAAVIPHASFIHAQQPEESSRSVSQNIALGAYYSRGDYGQAADTSIYYYPVSYDLSVNNWRFKLTVPHIEISGSGNVLVNIGGIGRGNFESDFRTDQNVTAKGLGDTTVSASYQFAPWFDGAPFMDITAEVKIPTADENKGLGTGKTDYALQLDLYQVFGQYTVFSTLGYRKREQSQLFEDLQDSLFVSLGLTRPLAGEWLEKHASGQWSYGLLYDYREPASLYSTETHELMPFVSWSPVSDWTLMTYVVKGFTRDSADTAIGTQLSYRW
jgi:hypothetical protein